MHNNKNLQPNWNSRALNKFSIGGQAFDPYSASNDDILWAIKSLPGNLENRARISTSYLYTPTLPASKDEMAAYTAANHFIESGDLGQLHKSINHYLAAAEQYEDMSMLQPAANMYSLAAQSYVNFPYNIFQDNAFLSEKSISYYDKAIELHDSQGHEDFSYRDRDKRYNAIAETVLAYRGYSQKGLSREDIQNRTDHYYDRLEPEAAGLLYSSRHIQGALDDKALRVEQKEIGISDSADIGTDNVSQCVTLIVRSDCKESGLEKSVVALAHIDYETEAESIYKIFENLPTGHKEARILGARFDQDPKSVENLVKVIRALSAYNVDVISSNVYQGDSGPSTVTVNPYDFSMRETVPTANEGMAAASCAYSLLTEDRLHPLRLAFDTRHGGERAPLYLTQPMVRKLRENYVDKDNVQRYEALKDDGLFDLGLTTHFFSSLVKQYENAVAAVAPYACEHLSQPIIDDMSLYIGKNALAHNINLVDAISYAYQQGENVSAFDYEERMQQDDTTSARFTPPPSSLEIN